MASNTSPEFNILGINTANSFRLIACPHPLSIDKGRIDRMVPEGGTVAEMIRGVLGWNTNGLTAIVFIDEQPIPMAQWEYAVPKAGQNLSVRVIPADGGSEQGKSALRIVAMLAIVVASAYTGGAAGAWAGGLLGVSKEIGAAIVMSTLTMAGSLAMTAHIPAPLPRHPLPLSIPKYSLKEVA